MCAAPSPALQTLQDPGIVPIYLGCPRSYPGQAPVFLQVVSARPSHEEAGGGARYVCAAPVGHTGPAVRGMACLAQPHAYETTPRQVQKVLADCPPVFAISARQCLELVRHISQEFTEVATRHELDALITNIARLAHAHRTLHLRAQRFGTPEQKATMAAMLQKHITSAENTLKTLQAFSGNLTLLSASVATDERATQELHFMHQGLQEVLQECNDAHQ